MSKKKAVPGPVVNPPKQNTVDKQSPTPEELKAASQAQILPRQQEIAILRTAHKFFSEFGFVPGSLTSPFSQALDGLAIVANSLIEKEKQEAPPAPPAK